MAAGKGWGQPLFAALGTVTPEQGLASEPAQLVKRGQPQVTPGASRPCCGQLGGHPGTRRAQATGGFLFSEALGARSIFTGSFTPQ